MEFKEINPSPRTLMAPGPVEAAGKKAADALDRISQKVGGLIKKTAQSGGQQENKESVNKEEC